MTPSRSRSPWAWTAIVLISALWLLLFRQLLPDWKTNPQYSYGWCIPFLALYLFWKRWLDRPLPCPAQVKSISALFGALLAVGYLGVRLVQEANRDWRLVSWVLALLVISYSLLCLYSMGGQPWLKHFFFPIAFTLTAVAWPHEMEFILVQKLMRTVAFITVEGLALIGISSVQHGNLIEVSTGMLGVEEACSGVRSLQSTLMASLFLGEMYRLRWPMRLSLVAIGLLLAFMFNVGRTFWLAVTAVRNGLDAVELIHDQAGLTILFCSFFILWGLANWLHRREPGAPNPVVTKPSVGVRPLSRGAILATLAVVLVAELGTRSWYSIREQRLVKTTDWGINWPTNLLAYEDLKITPAVSQQLGYDEGRGAAWLEADGSRWTAYFFRWNPGELSSRLLARFHRPEICLPSSGIELVSELGVRILKAPQLELPFRSYVFKYEGTPLYVFFCLWEDQAAPELAGQTAAFLPDSGRLKAVWEGKRHWLGQQTFEVIITGLSNIEEAEQALQSRLPALVRLHAPGR